VQFRRHAIFTLRVDPLEQIDLRRGALDIWQRVDSAKAIERAPDNDFD